MLPGNLKDFSASLFEAICKENWSESATLDFKRELPGTDDASKQEFLKDICAFANSNGGDLVYGVQDNSGTASKLFPIDASKTPVDATKRRLLQVLESNFEPPIQVEMRAVAVAGQDYVLVVRVPTSFQRPHRFKIGSQSRWVVRVDTHTVDLTYDQIRNAFDRGATLTDRARRFRDERITSMLAGTTGRPLRPGPRCLVHLIPLASIAGTVTVDIRHLDSDHHRFSFSDWGGSSRSFNLDGLIAFPGASTNDLAYTQVFRNGVMETGRWIGALYQHDDIKDAIPSGVVSGLVRDALTKFFAAAKDWNVGGPAIASVALLDLAGRKFFYQPRGYFTQQNAPDRPNLILPDVWIENLTSLTSPDEIIRPLLDVMWQAFDLDRCAFYDDQGVWGTH